MEKTTFFNKDNKLLGHTYSLLPLGLGETITLDGVFYTVARIGIKSFVRATNKSYLDCSQDIIVEEK